MTLVRSRYVADQLAAIEESLGKGAWGGAVTALNDAVAAAPTDPHVMHASGRLCELADRPEDALAQWCHAVALDPNMSASWSAIGTVLSRGTPITDPHFIALLAFAQAHKADPEWLLPAWHMAMLYHATGYGDAAQHALARVASILKQHGELPKNTGVVNLHNRSYMHLSLGHWGPGFRCYEYRLQDVGHALSDRARTRPPGGVPRWTGGDALPPRLAVFVEQGAGDMFMTLRYVAWLQANGCQVTLETFNSMSDMVAIRMIAEGVTIIPQDAPLPHEVDAYVWAMSLPGLLWDQDVPNTPTLSRKFRRPDAIKRVAFCWQGSRAHKSDKIRSMPVDALKPLAEWCRANGLVPTAVNPGEPPKGWLDDPSHTINTFTDTAAVLDECVAVVSVDTALVHLAGCMGVPTFAMLAALPDWRWGMVGKGHHQWYESVTLVRQPTINDWSSVVASVQQQLAETLTPSAT